MIDKKRFADTLPLENYNTGEEENPLVEGNQAIKACTQVHEKSLKSLSWKFATFHIGHRVQISLFMIQLIM